MIYLAYFVLLLAAIRLLVVSVNLIFNPQLKGLKAEYKPLVSVLIPARNEEQNISNLLNDLLIQDYTNLEVLVYDDNSTDRTQKIVQLLANSNPQIKLIKAESLPKGWLGKNYGCYLLAKQAKGEYLLFLDADVRIGNTVIESAIATLQKYNLGLLSVFPRQQILSAGEQLVVPIMNIILLSFLPLILVRASKRPSLAAANGQMMLFNKHIYQEFEPHLELKHNKVEDIAIARYFKKNKIKIDCLTGNTAVQCHMYSNFKEAINGFSKNLPAFFGNSCFISVLFWLLTTFGCIAVWATLPLFSLIVYISMVILSRIFVSVISEQSIFKNILFLIPQQFSMGYLNYQAIINYFFRTNTWKGRPIG